MKYALFVHVDFFLDHTTNNGIYPSKRVAKRDLVLGIKSLPEYKFRSPIFKKKCVSLANDNYSLLIIIGQLCKAEVNFLLFPNL